MQQRLNRVKSSIRFNSVDVETLETELGLVNVKRRKGRRRLSIVLRPLLPIEVRSNLRTSNQQIAEFILKKEGIKAEPAVLPLIALNARGSFRDAESLLDKCISFTAAGKLITVKEIKE